MNKSAPSKYWYGILSPLSQCILIIAALLILTFIAKITGTQKSTIDAAVSGFVADSANILLLCAYFVIFLIGLIVWISKKITIKDRFNISNITLAIAFIALTYFLFNNDEYKSILFNIIKIILIIIVATIFILKLTKNDDKKGKHSFDTMKSIFNDACSTAILYASLLIVYSMYSESLDKLCTAAIFLIPSILIKPLFSYEK